MAESVDALVSNTSRATCAGSIPALGTWKHLLINLILRCFCFICAADEKGDSCCQIRKVRLLCCERIHFPAKFLQIPRILTKFVMKLRISRVMVVSGLATNNLPTICEL